MELSTTLLLAATVFFAGLELLNGQSCQSDTSGLNSANGCAFETFSGGNFDCDGYAACHDMNLFESQLVILECRGAASCMNLETSDTSSIGQVHCDGYLSCANAVMDVTLFNIDDSGYPDIYCDGALSCANMVITANPTLEYTNASKTLTDARAYVRGFGYASLANADMTQTPIASGDFRGYYALYNAKIVMDDSSRLELYGRLSGYNGYAYCPANKSCVVDCNSRPTSCYGLTFDCGTPQTCSVTNCDEEDGRWCPLGTWKLRTNVDNRDYNLTWYPLQIDAIFIPDHANIARAQEITAQNAGIIDGIDVIDDLIHGGSCFKNAITKEGICDDDNSCLNKHVYYSAIGRYSSASEFWQNTSYTTDTALCARGANALRSSSSSTILDLDVGCVYDFVVPGENTQSRGQHSKIWARNQYGLADRSLYGASTELYGCSVIGKEYYGWTGENANEEDETSELHCLGYQSCVRANAIKDFDTVYCMAADACEISEMANVDTLYVLSNGAADDLAIEVQRGDEMNIYIEGTWDPDIRFTCQANEGGFAVVNVWCIDPNLVCGNKFIITNCYNNTIRIKAFENHPDFQPTLEPAPTVAPTDPPTDVFTTNVNVDPSSGSDGKSLDKDNGGSNDDIVMIIILCGVGFFVCICLVLCVVFKNRWLWMPGYVVAVYKNTKSSRSTRQIVSNNNVQGTNQVVWNTPTMKHAMMKSSSNLDVSTGRDSVVQNTSAPKEGEHLRP